MKPDLQKLDSLLEELKVYKATLVAVSKTRPSDAVSILYRHGHRDFGENYVQELVTKQSELPADIRWHFIGHLQSNKVKMIAPFVSLVHGVDSISLAGEISRQAVKNQREINVLLQVHISTEITKFGMSAREALQSGIQLINTPLPGVRVRGLMGIASLTVDENQIRKEFQSLRQLFDEIRSNTEHQNQFDVLSMGMSSDYKIALAEGSNMVRIGSAIFGERN